MQMELAKGTELVVPILLDPWKYPMNIPRAPGRRLAPTALERGLEAVS